MFKFAAVFLLTIVGSYVTSRFLVNRSSTAAVAGLAILFIGMYLAFR